MKLKYITLKNFRSYHGEQTLSFTTDEHRHVTVIHGSNGAGKTSLFVAFNWCLYGNEFIRAKFGNIGKLENRRALVGDESSETLVEIGFIYRGTQYCAKRITSGNSKTAFLLKTTNAFGLERELYDEDASERVKSIIPENVSVHFFFDGEQIYNFTKPGNEDEVKNAVRNVLRIEEIGRGMKHLSDITAEYRRELRRRSSGNLKKLLDEREETQIQRDNLSTHIQEKQREIEAAQSLKKGVDTRLKEIASSRVLAQERNNIEITLEKLGQDKQNNQTEIRQLVNQGFIPLAKPVIISSLEIIRQNEITSGIPKTLLNELLNQTNCLCGRPIQPESLEYQTILNLLNQAVSSESKYVAGQTESNLKWLLNNSVENIPTQLKSALGNVQQLDSKIKANETRLEKIKKELGSFDNSEVDQLEKARERYETDIRKFEAEINQTKGRIEEINKKISQLDENIRKEESSNERAEQLKCYYELADASTSAMEKIYELHAANMREQIQEEVGPIFKRLVWNADHFEAITLTENYRLLVIDGSGEDVLPEMSAGQRQVLSLSFIGALAKMSVKEMIPNMENELFPIVMDTPFGRLSSEHRENIADIFPQIADQLVLFVTDEELHGEARINLEPRIGAEYELQFTKEDKLTTTTTIKRIQ